MRGFLIRLAVFLSIQLVIAIGVLHFGSPDASNHYFSAMVDKSNRMKTLERPKLIITGGSNVAFGIDSRRVGEALNREAVNWGLHAGLGLNFCLEVVKQNLKRGDLVVISPEYELLCTEQVLGTPSTVQLLTEHWPQAKNLFFDVDFSWKNFLDNEAIWTAHVWWRRARHRILGRESPGDEYVRSCFNEFGDYIDHLDRESKQPTEPIDISVLDFEYVDLAVNSINDFAGFCNSRGIQVVFSFPPIAEDSFEHCKASVTELNQILKRRLITPIIDSPDELVFSTNQFYDSRNHLTKTGRRMRSDTMIANLLESFPTKVSEKNSETRLK